AWWEDELRRPLVYVVDWPSEGVQSLPDAPHIVANLPLDLSPEQVLAHYQPWLEGARYYCDAFPCWNPNFGPGAVAAFLGSVPRPVPGTVWFEPLPISDIAELRIAFDENSLWWRKVRDLTEAAVEHWGSAVALVHTDLGGNLDILAHLRGSQQLLVDLCDAPDTVERLCAEITQVWLRCYHCLSVIIARAGRGFVNWGPMWAPGTTYLLQSDFSYMISPRMFERFVLPDLSACCGAMEYPFYHLDGPGQIPHLDMILSLPALRGVQWVHGAPAVPMSHWLPLLQRIRRAGKLCQVVDASPEDALMIVRELGGRGFFFQLPPMSKGDAMDLAELLATEAADAR
ncbi:MAG: hypothetical protein ACUVX9_15385, partial [Anaerolineae bacterium]